ncbi:hypothetical protein C2G38_2295324 [Gigaspora rosea]|uniref:Uncharacterized protein n=1 Tax=Gigaspora rosea TaxID=44941 RepID=A0A397VTW5_9GLOM|nr:hypothetical protein C2G38_2295324 [Gigaspora rosea]
MAHFLFNSVFTETHPELDSLNTSILALQNTYQSTYSGDIEEDKINLIEEKEINILADEQLYNIESDIFSKAQIINFYKKYNQKVETKLIDNDSKNNTILTQQDIEAFCLKFDTFNCCLAWECTKKINREMAIKKWKNVQLLSKAEKNMLLLATINALTRKESTTEHENNKKYLTNEYRFDGDKICLKAFLLIYDLTRWKWDSIHKHFLEHVILPISHGLKNQNSNNKISFNNILHIFKLC